jgi:hypothetical protein
MRVLAIAVVLGLATDARADESVVAAGAEIAKRGCSSHVMGRPFRGAEMLCLAMTSAALTSVAIDDPRRVDAIVPLLDALVVRARGRSPRAPFPSTSVLYRGLLGTMLVARERIAPGRATDIDDLAHGLARDLEHGWIASYRDGTWPCDHAPALAFLRLHGALRGDAASTRAADALHSWLAMLVPVFPTRVGADGTVLDGDVRTTTLAFTAAFLLAAEPELARIFATAAITACDRAPMAACREWRTAARTADAASGPLVFGYATGATALAIIATRALADPDWNTALLATAELAGAHRLPRRGVERALLAWGRVARPW